MAWRGWPAGTARRWATTPSPSPSTRWWWRRSPPTSARAWPRKWRLAALLHDAAEYVIGDMISPFKAALGFDYRLFEARLEQAIHIRFGLPTATPLPIKTLIKHADRACAFFEATQLAGFETLEALSLFGQAAPRLRPDHRASAPARGAAALSAALPRAFRGGGVRGRPSAFDSE